jgi:glucose/mannose transport system substrate-binding protein
MFKPMDLLFGASYQTILAFLVVVIPSHFTKGENIMKRNIWYSLVVLLAVAATVLSACGPATTAAPTDVVAPADTAMPEDTEAAPGAKTQVEVFSWWTTGGEAAGLQKLIDQFNAAHPDAEVINAAVAGGAGSNAKAVLKTRMLGGDPPDSFQVHMGHELLDTWVTTDFMEPLDDVYAQYGFNDSFAPGVLAIVSKDGHPYSVPVNIHRANVLWYNVAVFEANGIDPDSIATFDGWKAAAEKLKAAGITPWRSAIMVPGQRPTCSRPF